MSDALVTEAHSSAYAADAAAGQPRDMRRLRLSTGVLCLLLLCAQLLPPVPMYVGAASSMAVGVVLTSAVCFIVVAACWAIGARTPGEGVLDLSGRGALLIATVVFLIILHGAVADDILGIDLSRFFDSLIPLVLLIAAALALDAAIRGARSSQIETMCWVSFWALCAVAFLKVTGLEPRAGTFGKSMFPFTEPSHFALAFGPIFLYRCASARAGRRGLWVLFGCALAIGVQNGTLLVIAVVGAMVSRRFLIVVGLGVAVALVGLTADLKYFTSRADISSRSSNLTALVYLEGWQLLGSSLAQSHGWGLGFQQLGVHDSDVSAAKAIERITGGSALNQMDGSFVLSKLGSEFGVIGLLLVAVYCVIAVKCLVFLRAGRGPPGVRLASSIVLAYSVDMFVRGIGYFSPSSLLFVAALLVLAPQTGLLRAGSGPRRDELMVLR